LCSCKSRSIDSAAAAPLQFFRKFAAGRRALLLVQDELHGVHYGRRILRRPTLSPTVDLSPLDCNSCHRNSAHGSSPTRPKRVLDDIQSGKFTRDWMLENKADQTLFKECEAPM
jgi:hypothetical protein